MAANWLDRAVGFFSPERGLRRAWARAGMEALGGVVQGVRRTAASREGTLANFYPTRQNTWAAERDADLIRDRAESLIASDGLAASCINSLALNIIGPGLRPQSTPDTQALDISDDEADAFAESAERAWELWCREADAAGCDHFNDLQYQAMHTLLGLGEFIQIPVWIDEPGRHFGLALQTLHPSRLRTPCDLQTNPNIRRGIEIGDYGRPVAYWLAEPADNRPVAGLSSAHFRRVPRMVAHRWGCFHRRNSVGPEALRGESILAPAMKLFADLSAYVDSELVGAVIAASLTIFIEAGGNAMGLPDVNLDGSKKTSGKGNYPLEVSPGTVVSGRPGDKPHLLANPRPSDSFDPFYSRLSKLVTATAGQSLGIVSKDFSQSNYSSARAELLEAGKVHILEQDRIIRGYLQCLYEMVLEEAYWRGMLTMPRRVPDFYAGRAALCASTWTRPPRGQIDIVKERTGEQLGLSNLTDSHSDILNARGTDTETMARKIARDRRILKRYNLDVGISSVSLAVQVPANDDDESPKKEADQ
ncbi:MAG TPA: phage portal protein [Solidesulfovibrio magneticus]|nr:phage portal protein [Solidesulfovibrio magneticus]